MWECLERVIRRLYVTLNQLLRYKDSVSAVSCLSRTHYLPFLFKETSIKYKGIVRDSLILWERPLLPEVIINAVDLLREIYFLSGS